MGEYLFLLYGALAFVALWATWRDRDLIWIGAWLVMGWAASNALDWWAPVKVMPGPYSIIEFMVLYAASLAWWANKKHWPLLLLCGVAVLSICANIAFTLHFPPTKEQIYLWKLATNLCFAAECLLATATGVADGYRTGRFHRLPRFFGRAVAPNAAREIEP